MTSLWTLKGQSIDFETAYSNFGKTTSMSSDGNIVAISAPYSSTTNGNNIGIVRVYQYGSVTQEWTQMGQDIEGEAEYNESGDSISLSSDGMIVAIGAIRNRGSVGYPNSGHVRIYQYISNTWTQVGQDIDGNNRENFGHSISLSSDGNMIAIGATYFDGTEPSRDNCGRTQVYENISGTWTQVGQDIEGSNQNDYSGSSVSLSNDGTIVAIGDKGFDTNTVGDQGRVRVFKKLPNELAWTQLGTDIIENIENIEDGQNANYGQELSLSSDGNIVAISSPYYSQNSGSVVVYQYNINNQTWNKLGQNIINTETQNALLGYFLSLSDDGMTIAVGTQAGFVKVYKLIDATWSQVGQTFDQTRIPSSVYFQSVCLSGDGMTVVVSDSGYNNNSGTRVQVYQLSTNTNIDIVCFLEGTQIACLDEETAEETQLNIEDITPGTLVKTYVHGFVPVDCINYKMIENPTNTERVKNRLYKCSPDKYPGLKKDLILTGSHAILENKLSIKQKNITLDELGDIFVTDGKLRLIAMADERAEPYVTKSKQSKVWHVCLEHEDYNMNYGIYANGLLVESCSKRNMDLGMP